MGVTINGFATKADKESTLKHLEKACQLVNSLATIVKERDEIFEEIVRRKTDQNIIDIYSTNKGSLLTMSSELFEKFSRWELSKSYEVDYFDICETSMSHRFAVFSEGKETVCMNIWDKGSTKDILGDNYLNIEQDEDVFFNVFPRLADKYTNQSFHEIDLGTKIERYRLVFEKPKYEPLKQVSPTPESKKSKGIWKRLFSK